MADYRILSLDGGGTWALLQVRALWSMYGDMPGRELLKRFDLVAANSGGSIVLAAMASGMQLSQIDDWFHDEARRRQVFVELPWYKKLNPIRLAGVGPRYSAVAKLEGLRSLVRPVADLSLPDLAAQIRSDVGKCPDLLISSFDYDRRRASFFRSNWKSMASSSFGPDPSTIAQAVHASSNAPLNYFDAPAIVGSRRFWDGAVGGYNNPVLAAVIESKANQINVQDIRILSLGTGGVVLPLPTATVGPPMAATLNDPGLTNDLSEMATSILDDPPDAATFAAHVALGGPLPAADGQCTMGPVVRLSPLIQPIPAGPGLWQLPTGISADEFSALQRLEMDAISNEDVSLIDLLCDGWITDSVPNQPIRANKDLFCQVGWRRFTDGVAAWKAIDAGVNLVAQPWN